MLFFGTPDEKRTITYGNEDPISDARPLVLRISGSPMDALLRTIPRSSSFDWPCHVLGARGRPSRRQALRDHRCVQLEANGEHPVLFSPRAGLPTRATETRTAVRRLFRTGLADHIEKGRSPEGDPEGVQYRRCRMGLRRTRNPARNRSTGVLNIGGMRPVFGRARAVEKDSWLGCPKGTAETDAKSPCPERLGSSPLTAAKRSYYVERRGRGTGFLQSLRQVLEFVPSAERKLNVGRTQLY